MRRDEVEANEPVVSADALLASRRGQREIVVDVTAAGQLRKQLIETLGVERTRAMIVKYGYTQGYGLGQSVRERLATTDEDRIADIVSRAVVLGGMARVIGNDVLGSRGLVVEESYEAELHMLSVGRATEPVCWTLRGFIGGLASTLLETEIVAFEDRCVAKGDASCRLVTRPGREEASPEEPVDVRPLADIEREYIIDTLEKNAGNQTKTAKQLGIGSATLYRKLQSYRGSTRKARK